MRHLIKKAMLPLVLAISPLSVSACGFEPFIGTICTFAFNFCPRGFAETNGQLLPISQNTALFALIGTMYGGDGITTFALPDLRSRTIVGAGTGVGLSPVAVGQQGGLQSVKLTTGNLPSHTHTATTTITSSLRGTNAVGNLTTPQANILSKSGTIKTYRSGTVANVTLGASSISSTGTTRINAAGGSQPFENRQPFLGVTTCIAVEGIFPSRN
jgi:microcystin-dependent protein